MLFEKNCSKSILACGFYMYAYSFILWDDSTEKFG